jgi:hypothetical protein
MKVYLGEGTAEQRTNEARKRLVDQGFEIITYTGRVVMGVQITPEGNVLIERYFSFDEPEENGRYGNDVTVLCISRSHYRDMLEVVDAYEADQRAEQAISRAERETWRLVNV